MARLPLPGRGTGPRVVALGGGHGLAASLAALRLVVEDITVGDGAEVTPGSPIQAHYVGVAHSTGEEFDASWNRGAPLAFTAGIGENVWQVREQALSALADETRRMLDEEVVAAPMDIDLAMITGAGFQFWNGGLTPLLDREGVSEKVTGQRFLPKGVASVPA